MSLRKLLSKLSYLVVLVTFLASTSFGADLYVNQTNGDDGFNDGSQAKPFRSITKAISVAQDGDVIYVAAGVYSDAIEVPGTGGTVVAITKGVKIIGTSNSAAPNQTVIQIDGGININPGLGKSVTLAKAVDGSLAFNLGSTASALTLTSGSLDLTGANVTIGSGATITRIGGAITDTPNTSNVNVTYNGGTLTAGPEIPATLGKGNLLISAGKVSFNNPLLITTDIAAITNITLNGGDATFTGAVTFDVVKKDVAVGGTPTLVNVATANKASFASIAVNTSGGGTAAINGMLVTGVANAELAVTSVLTSGKGTLGITNTNGKVILTNGSINGAVTVGNSLEALGNIAMSGATVANAGTIKLNSNTLTFDGTTAYSGAGSIISTSAGVVGNGKVEITKALTKTNTGSMPNVSVLGSGALVLNANTQMDGTYIQNSTAAPALAVANGVTMTVLGDWTRETSNPLDVAFDQTGGAGATLAFTATPAQTWNPGASLRVMNVIVNKAGIGVGDLTMAATVEVAGNFNIAAGRLNLGNYNIRLVTNNAGTFTNTGSFYTSSGAGFLVVEGLNKILAGTGTFGNTDVRITAANAVTLANNINLSGTIILRSGDLGAAAAPTINLTSTNVTYPKIIRNVEAALAARMIAGVTVPAGVTYDLEYFGANGPATLPVGGELVGANLRNLSNIATTAAGTDVTGAAGTLAGILTIAKNQEITGNFSSAANGTHQIQGTLDGNLTLTGAASGVQGLTSTGNQAAITGNLKYDPTVNNGVMTVAGLVTLGGNLTIDPTLTTTGTSANVTFESSVNATLTGNVVVGTATSACALNLSLIGKTASTLGGSVTVTNGDLTITRGDKAVQNTVTGAITLTKGSMTLGSNLTANALLTQTDANLVLGAYSLDLLAGLTYNGPGVISSTGGYLIAKTNSQTLTANSKVTIPKLKLDVTAANTVTLATNTFVITEELWQFTGDLADGGQNIEISGDLNWGTGTNAVVGAYGGTGNLVFTGSNFLIKEGTTLTVPNIIINTDGTTYLKSTDSTSPINNFVTVQTSTFNQTKGNVDLDMNKIEVTGAASAFVRGTTAGSWAMTTGELAFNGAGLTFNPGASWVVDNLNVIQAASNVGKNDFMVNKKLSLSGAFDVSTSATEGNMSIGEDGTILRTAAAAVLDKTPNYAGMFNLQYSTANITTAKELPAGTDKLNNLSTLTAVPVTTTLAEDVVVNGTLSLLGKLDNTNKSITMADSSTLELKDLGTNVLAKNLIKLGSMELVYNGAATVSQRELGDISSGAYPVYNGNITIKAALATTLASDLTVNGNLTFDGGSLTLADNMSVTGNVVSTTTTGGGGFLAGGAFFFNFIGSDNTALSLDGNTAVPGATKIRLKKESNENYITLSGGNLNFQTNGSILYFNNGVLVTGDNQVILRHSEDVVNGIPVQGFDRTGVTGDNSSHIVGNVSKLLDALGLTAWVTNPKVALTRVEFPVGTMPHSAPNYRPMAYQFNTLPTANLTLTVNHVEETPGGDNGFPITDGDLTIVNYPDFYWLIKSTLTLQPQVKYDIEASAEGYTDFQTDGIQNVRFIRRFDNNTDNPWLLQGGLGYDNSTDGSTPVVIVRSAEGAVSTQGARFTYSQLAKPPVITKDVVSPQVINEGDTLIVNYTAEDPDLGGSVTLTTESIPSTATYAASSVKAGKLTWITAQADTGSHKIIMKAVDAEGAITYDTLVVTVNDITSAPVFTKTMGDTTARADYAFSFQYEGNDPDGQAVSYFLESITGNTTSDSAVVSAAGLLTWSPKVADVDSVAIITVGLTDGSDTTMVTDTIKVVGNTKPVWASALPDTTIFVGDTLKWTYIANDADNDQIIYSFGSNFPENEASLDSLSGLFIWVPTTASQFPVYVPVNATDGTAIIDTQASVVVKEVTADVTGTLTYNVTSAVIPNALVTLTDGVNSYEDSTDANGVYTITGVAAGEYTLTAVKTNGYGGVLASDALEVQKYEAGDTTALATALQMVAADVDSSGDVDAIDALIILNRSVDNKLASFTLADWQFESKSVKVGSAGATKDLMGICAGDARSDFNPAGGIAKASVSFDNSEIQKIKKSAEFKLPVSVREEAEVGSFTLKLRYPADQIEFLGVVGSGIVSNVNGGVISLAWANANKPLNIKEDGVLAQLRFKAVEGFDKGSEAGLELLDGSEITDVAAKTIASTIAISSVEVGIPESFDLGQNYPNPFNPTTTIKYGLPANGKVSLTVFNTLGQIVETLVDTKQEAGEYEVKFNAQSMASGVYLYRIIVTGGAKDFVQTKKMLLLK